MSKIPHDRRGRRRKGMPFRAKRETRWICDTQPRRLRVEGAQNPCSVDGCVLSRALHTCCPSWSEVLSGTVDFDKLDSQEHTLLRVVGVVDTNVEFSEGDVIGTAGRPMVRYGLLATHDVDVEAATVVPDLFDREDLERFSWLQVWYPDLRWHSMVLPSDGYSPSTTTGSFTASVHFEFDITVKRRMFRESSLWLVRAMNPATTANSMFESRILRMLVTV